MNRRKFILGSITSGVIIGGGAAWFVIEQNQEPLDIDFALSKLEKLIQQNPKTTGEWNLYQIFTHLAQSVEYSMTGYPKHKSDIFKHTAGTLAFTLFSTKKRMTHPLNEPIPGAPDFLDKESITEAIERFKKSLIDFKEYDGELKTHFAYGQLTKQQYEAAHVMHFNNHLLEFALTSSIS